MGGFLSFLGNAIAPSEKQEAITETETSTSKIDGTKKLKKKKTKERQFEAEQEKQNNEIDLGEERSAMVDEFDFHPTKAVINKDETIDIYYDWSFGSDEDSMKKMKFMSSGVVFFAKQGSDWLEDDLVNSSGLYSDVYEKSEASFIIKFKLNNKTDDVVLSFNVNGQPSGRDSYTIKLPEVK